MGSRAGALTVLAALLIAAPARAHLLPRPFRLGLVNLQLYGQVIDYTNNHVGDHRIWSASLGEKRDLYVYLPPGYDPRKRYPLGIYLHGFLSDEDSFLRHVVKPFDAAIAKGELPPIIIAAPDGSPRGLSCLTTAGTFYVNSNLGAFEDFLVRDVYDFLMSHYPIRPEPEAHVLLGVSMGGAAAFANVMKHRDKFGVAATFAPPLNIRWISCRGRYLDDFDPCCWEYRTDFTRGRDVVGVFLGGLVKVRLRSFINPLYGKGNPDTAELTAAENPIELLDALDIQPGFAEFYVAYGGKDQFNLDAQIESFLYRAGQKGIEVAVDYLPGGKHDPKTALRMLAPMLQWLRVRLEPYSPR
jgi:S-formylglutathione hydrolase FrmB